MTNLGFDPFWRWLGSPPPSEDPPGFQVRPTNVGPIGVPGLHDWRPPTTGAGLATPDDTPPDTASPPWWGPSTGPSAVFGNTSQPYLPWLRAPTDVPGFRPSPDGSAQTGPPGGDVRLMEGAFPRIEPQEQPDDVAGTNGVASGDVRLMAGAFAPIEPQEGPNDFAGSDGTASSDRVAFRPPGVVPSATSAASIAVPASAAAPIDLAALAARVAPAVAAAAGPAAAAALPFLLIPTNTQSETADLGDGLRARVRPGQRSVEVERRVHNGLFGIGAKWETLPVEAWQKVGRDGSVDTVINHEQLNRALGRSAPAESVDAGANAMARPPRDADPPRPPPADPGSTASESDGTDPRTPPVPLAPTRIDAKVLDEARQRDPEEERVLACRAVREMPGLPAPRGQYSGPDGVDTAVNIRVAPGFPAPKGGYAYDPDYLRHWNGYRGELELKNRIENAIPYEKIVHYGNPAGEQGPDVFTIGPEGLPMEWDSKSRSATRQVGRSMIGIPSLRYSKAKEYVDRAVDAGALARDVGDTALHELSKGNYNLCIVGTGNAYDGYFKAVRKGIPSGPQR